MKRLKMKQKIIGGSLAGKGVVQASNVVHQAGKGTIRAWHELDTFQ